MRAFLFRSYTYVLDLSKHDTEMIGIDYIHRELTIPTNYETDIFPPYIGVFANK